MAEGDRGHALLSPRRRWWPRSVRVRTAASATLVVALTLALAAGALVVLQRSQLVDAVSATAAQQSSDVAARVRSGGVAAAGLDGPGAARGDQALVQVVAADGRVLAHSPEAGDEEPLTGVRPGAGDVLQDPRGRLEQDGDPYAVVARGVATPDGAVVTVVAARSLDTVERSTAIAVTLIAVGYPLVLLVVAGASWWLTGRALAPMTAIRRRVAEVSASDLAARVPVPPGGDEVAALATTMNAMLARLEASAQAQRRFVADASHELRSPLSTVRAAAELSSAHPGDFPWDEAATTVLAETDRLERLVGDLLLLARSDEHGLVMRPGDVDLDDVVAAEAQRLRRVSARSIHLHLAPVRVRGDAAHLARAVRNLADNADAHAAGEVWLTLSSVDGEAVVEVGDDGPGIAAGERERVFERFVRLDASRERASGGSGLGLAIVRQIALAHGGRASAGGRAGGGTTMTLGLPAEPAAPGEPDAAGADALLLAQPPSAARR